MVRLRTLIAATAALVLGGGSLAQSSPERAVVPLGSILGLAANQLGPEPISGTNIALRGGAMFSPRGAGLAGLDFDLPQLSLMPNWSGRVDADVIFKANFSGLRTVVPVTLNQIYTSPNVAGRSFYFGGGAGALLGGKAKLDIKALAGVGLTRNMDIEVNAHFLERDTLVTALVRLSR